MELTHLVFLRNGKIFTVKRADEPMKGLYSLPGGRIENETPEQALLREIKEEIGVVLDQPEYLGKIKYQNESLSFSVDYFKCEFDESEIVLNKEEVEEARWMNVDDFCSGLKRFGLNTESVDNLNKLLNNIGL